MSIHEGNESHADTLTGSDAAARARALLDAATPGPWEACTAPHPEDDKTPAEWLASCLTGDGELWCVTAPNTTGDGYGYLIPAVTGDGPFSEAHAALIAAAPTLITDLLAEVDRLHSLTEGDPNTIYHEAAQLRAERDAAAARADALTAAIREHHEAIWSEWSQTSRSIPPPADVALWAHVDIDPAARFAAERDRGTDR